MAPPRLRAITDPDDAIPSPRDDPRHIEATTLRRAFIEHEERLKAERARLQLEQHFAQRGPRDGSQEDQGLWARLIALRALAPLTPAPSPKSASPSPAIAAGMRVLEGGQVEPAPDLRSQMRRVEQQLAVLAAAITDQDAVIVAITEDASAAIAQQIKPTWDKLVLQMFRDAQQLSASTSRFRQFRYEIIAAGVTGNSTVLRAPNVRSPLQLGDESDWGSEISTWRRTLENWRLL